MVRGGVGMIGKGGGWGVYESRVNTKQPALEMIEARFMANCTLLLLCAFLIIVLFTKT